MRKALSASAIVFGLIASSLLIPAAAQAADGDSTCDLPGSGTVGAPWQVDSQADLLEIGIGDCISTYNSAHHYIQTADIELTGNWTPIALKSTVATSYDGDGHIISGLVITSSASAQGFFSYVENAVVKDLYLRGSSVSGGTWVGSLAADVRSSTVENIHIQLSEGVTGSGQQVGGIIGISTNSTLTNLSLVAGGTVSGSAYSGGGIGTVDGSGTVSHIAVKADVSLTGIGGGVIGKLVPASNTDLQGLYFDGNLTADQYVGGLIGYVFGYSSHTVHIGNSAVRGNVRASGAYTPAVLIGQVGSGISAVSTSFGYSTASFFTNATSAVSGVRLHNGSPSMTPTGFAFEPGSGTSITTDGTSTTGITSISAITSAATAPISSWTIVAETGRSGSVSGTWVIDTTGQLNNGRPMLVKPYLQDFYGEILSVCAAGEFARTQLGGCIDAPAGYFAASAGSREALPCPAGRFQAMPGQTACVDASPGSFVDLTGQSAETACPAGTYQPSSGAVSCLPAQTGYYVASPGATTALQCPAGTTTLAVSQTACVPIAAAEYSGPIISRSVEVAPGGQAVLSGSTLSGITKVTVEGVDCKIESVTDSSITLSIPSTLTAGKKDLVITSPSGSLTVQGALIVFRESSIAAASTSIKRIGDKVRLAVGNAVGVGKIQFLVNGKEVAWVKAIDGSNPKLRNGKYFVRTTKLAAGKNLVEIKVAGKSVAKSTLTK